MTNTSSNHVFDVFTMLPALRRGRFGVLPVCLSVPWRSCLGYSHAGCLQLSHRLPPEMRGLRTRPRTDVDPPRFLDRTAIGGGISSRRRRGRYLVPPPHVSVCAVKISTSVLGNLDRVRTDVTTFRAAICAPVRPGTLC